MWDFFSNKTESTYVVDWHIWLRSERFQSGFEPSHQSKEFTGISVITVNCTKGLPNPVSINFTAKYFSFLFITSFPSLFRNNWGAWLTSSYIALIFNNQTHFTPYFQNTLCWPDAMKKKHSNNLWHSRTRTLKDG